MRPSNASVLLQRFPLALYGARTPFTIEVGFQHPVYLSNEGGSALRAVEHEAALAKQGLGSLGSGNFGRLHRDWLAFIFLFCHQTLASLSLQGSGNDPVHLMDDPANCCTPRPSISSS